MRFQKPVKKRKKTPKKKEKKLTLLTKEAQTVFNRYIRKRDSENGYFTCISCQKTMETNRMNAGHYVPVARSKFLRFNEWNTNGECEGCNCFDEFHLIGYKKNLTEKIGKKAVEWLEDNSRKLKKYTREELEEIIKKYEEK